MKPADRTAAVIKTAFTIAALLLSAGAANAMSLAQYLDLEANAVDRKTGSPVALLYMKAAHNALGYANAILSNDGALQLYCQPKNLALHDDSLRKLLETEAQLLTQMTTKTEFTQFANTTDLAAFLLISLQKTFPCSRP